MLKLETPSAYEARNYPDSFTTLSESSPRYKLSWRAKMDIEHSNRWETDPEYRQNCIENEMELQRRKQANYHY